MRKRNYYIVKSFWDKETEIEEVRWTKKEYIEETKYIPSSYFITDDYKVALNRKMNEELNKINEHLNMQKDMIAKQKRILENFKDGEVTFKTILKTKEMQSSFISKIDEANSGIYFYKDRKEYFVPFLIIDNAKKVKIENVDGNKIYLSVYNDKILKYKFKIIVKQKIVVDIIERKYFILNEEEIIE